MSYWDYCFIIYTCNAQVCVWFSTVPVILVINETTISTSFMSQRSIKQFMKAGRKRSASSDTESMPSPKRVTMDTAQQSNNKENGDPPSDINQQKSEFDTMFDKLSAHLAQLTTTMENNLSAKITASISTVVAKEIATAMQGVREEFNAELKTLKDRLQAVEARPLLNENATYAAKVADNMDNVLYMTGIPVSDHENIVNKAVGVIKDGCHAKDIKVTTAERKKGYNGKPGVVIVKVENKEQVDLVMAGVKHLKTSHSHKKIFVNRHMSKDIRAMKSNARTLLKACGKDQDFIFKGPFLVKKNNAT